MPMPARVAVLSFALLSLVAASAQADADPGAKIASQGTSSGVAPCMTCHGADGAGIAATGYPRIAGLDAGYLSRQLRDFRAGRRNNPIMMPLAKNLTDAEVAAVSTYYALLPVPVAAVQPPAEAIAKTALDLQIS